MMFRNSSHHPFPLGEKIWFFVFLNSLQELLLLCYNYRRLGNIIQPYILQLQLSLQVAFIFYAQALRFLSKFFLLLMFYQFRRWPKNKKRYNINPEAHDRNTVYKSKRKRVIISRGEILYTMETVGRQSFVFLNNFLLFLSALGLVVRAVAAAHLLLLPVFP